MGTDIDGVIERGTGDVERALFAGRGLPDDTSDAVRDAGIGGCRHGHTHVTWAEVAAVDRDAPLASRPAWYCARRSVPTGERLVRVTPSLREAAAKTFGGTLLLAPPEWPPGGIVYLDGAVYRPVMLTARMLAPPGEGCRPRIRRAMRELATGHDDEGVWLVARFG